jgi:hypothetical protein
MSNVKINDLANSVVTSTMQFETDISGTTANKVSAAALKNYIGISVGPPATYLAAETITGSDRNLPVAGNGGPVTLTSVPQIAPDVTGERKTLIGTSNVNTLTVVHGNGLSLENGLPFTIGLNDIIEFVRYNSLWNEKTRKST